MSKNKHALGKIVLSHISKFVVMFNSSIKIFSSLELC